MAKMNPPPLLSAPLPRLSPQFSQRLRGHSRSPSRSPTRQRITDDILSDLSPASTLEAFTSPSGSLKASIEAATSTERAFGIRAAVASKKIHEWVTELSGWPWPEGSSEGFEVPIAKRRKLSEASRDHRNVRGRRLENGRGIVDDTIYWGSLPARIVIEYEARIEDISEDMADLDVEEIKSQVLHTLALPEAQSTSDNGTVLVQAYARMDDFTAVVTTTVLRALPILSRLMALIGVWSARLKILRQTPDLLLALDGANVALQSGWDTLSKTTQAAIDERTTVNGIAFPRETFNEIRRFLQDSVTDLGQQLDYMLDTLEGRTDTIPETWLGRMEAIEQDYGEWVVCGDRKVREGEWAYALAKRQPTLSQRPPVEDSNQVSQPLHDHESHSSVQPVAPATILPLQDDSAIGSSRDEYGDELDLSSLQDPSYPVALQQPSIAEFLPFDGTKHTDRDDLALEAEAVEKMGQNLPDEYRVEEPAQTPHLFLDQNIQHDAQPVSPPRIYPLQVEPPGAWKDESAHDVGPQAPSPTNELPQPVKVNEVRRLDEVTEPSAVLEQVQTSPPIHPVEETPQASGIAHGDEVHLGSLYPVFPDGSSVLQVDSSVSTSKEESDHIPEPVPFPDPSTSSVPSSLECKTVPADSTEEMDRDDLKFVSLAESHLPEQIHFTSQNNDSVGEKVLYHSLDGSNPTKEENPPLAPLSVGDHVLVEEIPVSKQDNDSNGALITPLSVVWVTAEDEQSEQPAPTTPRTPVTLKHSHDLVGPASDVASNTPTTPVTPKRSNQLNRSVSDDDHDSIILTSPVKPKNSDWSIKPGSDIAHTTSIARTPSPSPSSSSNPSSATILGRIIKSPSNQPAAGHYLEDGGTPRSPSKVARFDRGLTNSTHRVAAPVGLSASRTPNLFSIKPNLESSTAAFDEVLSFGTLELPETPTKLAKKEHDKHYESKLSPAIISAKDSLSPFQDILLPLEGSEKLKPTLPEVTHDEENLNISEHSRAGSDSLPISRDSSPVVYEAKQTECSTPLLSPVSGDDVWSHTPSVTTTTMTTPTSSLARSPERMVVREDYSNCDSPSHLRDLFPSRETRPFISEPEESITPRRSSVSSTTSTIVHGSPSRMFETPVKEIDVGLLESEQTPQSINESAFSPLELEDTPSFRRLGYKGITINSSPPNFPPIPAISRRRSSPLLSEIRVSIEPESDSLLTATEAPSFANVGVSTAPLTQSPVKNADEQLQHQISEILEKIPAKIRLTSEPDLDTSMDTLQVKKGRNLRAGPRPMSRAATPSFTLAPAFAKTHRPRPQSGNSEIKLYHLSRSTGEAPIKLHVRLVGETGERVMVRVGGGWSDLGEYLREYANHHGRRSDAADKVEVQNLPSRVVSTGSTRSIYTTRNDRSSPISRPTSSLGRPLSSLGMRKTRKSVGEESGGRDYRSPSTPLSFTSHALRTFDANDFSTPPSATSIPSRSSSRMSWTNDGAPRGDDEELGLAGPKGRKAEMSAEKAAWVESMKEKVRQASAEKEKKEFGTLGRIGGTKRLFKKT